LSLFLQQHRETALDTEAVAHWVDCKKERDDEATVLVDLLHLFLHGLKCTFLLRRGNLSHYPVLFGSIRHHDSRDVAGWFDLRTIDDQGFAVSEALANVEVAPVPDPSACLSERRYCFFISLDLC